MPETEATRYRLGSSTLTHLDALAASAGSRTQAIREAVAYWHAAVLDAGRRNADELSEEDWERLAHLNHPDPLPAEVRSEEERSAVTDWSKRLAVELVGAWEGRLYVLALHKQEATECRKLARRIGNWGMVRGYALYACLRWFWSHEETPKEWWRPEVWLTGEGK